MSRKMLAYACHLIILMILGGAATAIADPIYSVTAALDPTTPATPSGGTVGYYNQGPSSSQVITGLNYNFDTQGFQGGFSLNHNTSATNSNVSTDSNLLLTMQAYTPDDPGNPANGGANYPIKLTIGSSTGSIHKPAGVITLTGSTNGGYFIDTSNINNYRVGLTTGLALDPSSASLFQMTSTPSKDPKTGTSATDYTITNNQAIDGQMFKLIIRNTDIPSTTILPPNTIVDGTITLVSLDSTPAVATPEPSTMAILGLGAFGLIVARRRSRRA